MLTCCDVAPACTGDIQQGLKDSVRACTNISEACSIQSFSVEFTAVVVTLRNVPYQNVGTKR